MPFVYSTSSGWGSTNVGGTLSTAGVWQALNGGTIPTFALGADAGTGATYTITTGANRLNLRIAITTGSGPNSGGTLGTFTVSGYSYPPYVKPSPVDATSAATFPYCTTTITTAALSVAGEIEPGTTYTFDLVFLGT